MRQSKPVQYYANEISEVGKSRMVVGCPFCGEKLWVYKWSYAGCGKKCTCGALLASGTAFKEVPDETSKV